MGTTTESKFLTLGEFGQHVEAVCGFGLGDMKADGVRLVSEPGRHEAPMYIEFTTLCRNENGQRYIGDDAEVSMEVRRFPIVALTLGRSL